MNGVLLRQKRLARRVLTVAVDALAAGGGLPPDTVGYRLKRMAEDKGRRLRDSEGKLLFFLRRTLVGRDDSVAPSELDLESLNCSSADPQRFTACNLCLREIEKGRSFFFECS